MNSARVDRQVLGAIGLVGGAATLVGFHSAPERTWSAWLVASLLVTGLGLAGPLFVALQEVSGATWSTAIRRVPEAMGAILPIGTIGLATVFTFHPELYPWMAGTVELPGFEGWWLRPGFFWLRFAAYFTLWGIAVVGLRRASAALEDDDDPGRARSGIIRWSVAFLLIFGLTFWLASVDWIMSLEPEWHSTIFGVYQFAGLFASGLAAITLLALWQARRGALAGFLRPAHRRDLGKLLFAFSTFWMYVWFSQYLLIWYANLPDEAAYFVHRRADGWLGLFYLNILLNWAVPFVPLLSALAKRDGKILAAVASVMLVGRWLDLYLMVVPAAGAAPAIGVPEVGPLLVLGAGSLWRFERAFRAAEPVPRRDPALVLSLSYEG